VIHFKPAITAIQNHTAVEGVVYHPNTDGSAIIIRANLAPGCTVEDVKAELDALVAAANEDAPEPVAPSRFRRQAKIYYFVKGVNV
jgi:hypothetical protein